MLSTVNKPRIIDIYTVYNESEKRRYTGDKGFAYFQKLGYALDSKRAKKELVNLNRRYTSETRDTSFFTLHGQGNFRIFSRQQKRKDVLRYS